MKKVSISQDDIFTYRLKDTDEVVEMFGEDYLTDYGINVPSELVSEYKLLMKQYEELQDKLLAYYKKQYE